MKKALFLTAILTIVSMSAFATSLIIQDVPEVDLTSTNVIIGILTPLVTLGATWSLKKLSGLLSLDITGTATLVAVPVVAGIFTWITQTQTNTDLSWIIQVLLGVGGTYFHQAYLYLTGKIDSNE